MSKIVKQCVVNINDLKHFIDDLHKFYREDKTFTSNVSLEWMNHGKAGQTLILNLENDEPQDDAFRIIECVAKEVY